MTRTILMSNGISLAPFHSLDQDPTEALHRDLELLESAPELAAPKQFRYANKPVGRAEFTINAVRNRSSRGTPFVRFVIIPTS